MSGRTFSYQIDIQDNGAAKLEVLRAQADAVRQQFEKTGQSFTTAGNSSKYLISSLDPAVSLTQQFAVRLGELSRAGADVSVLKLVGQDFVTLEKNGINAVQALRSYEQAQAVVIQQANSAHQALIKQAAGFQTAGSGARAVQQEVNVVTSALQKMASEVIHSGGEVGGLTNNIGGLVSHLAEANPALLATVAALAALAVALKSSAEEAAHFQTLLVNIQANTGASSGEMLQVADVLKSSITQTNAEMDKLGQGMRQLMDFSFDAADGQKILTASMQVSAAAGADVAEVTNLLAQSLHHYRESADEAGKYTDILLVASQRSNASFEQFAENANRATGVAANLGVPIEQVAAALSALTRNGFNASEAQTQFINILTHLVHPAAQAADEFDNLAQKVGDSRLASDNLINTLSTEGLTGIIEALDSAFKKLGYSQNQVTQETLKLLNAQRGGLGMSVLLGKGQADYNENIASFAKILSGQATPAADAFHRSQQTLEFQTGVVGNKLQALGIEVGTHLLPALTAIVQAFGFVVDAVKAVSEVFLSALAPLEAYNSHLDEVAAKNAQLDASISSTADNIVAESAKADTAFRSSLGRGATDTAGVVSDASSEMAAAVDEATSNINQDLKALADAYRNASDDIQETVVKFDPKGWQEQAQAAWDQHQKKISETASLLTANLTDANRNEIELQAQSLISLRQLMSQEQQHIAAETVLKKERVDTTKASDQEIIAALQHFVGQYKDQFNHLNESQRQQLAEALEMLDQYKQKVLDASRSANPSLGTGGVDTKVAEDSAKEIEAQGRRLKVIYDQIAKDAEQKDMSVLQSLEHQRTETKSKLDDINASLIAAQHIGGGFGAAMTQYYSDLASNAQKDLGLIDEAIKGLGAGDQFSAIKSQIDDFAEVLGSKGPAASREYAQGLLDELNGLPDGVKATIQPVIDYLEELVSDGGVLGAGMGDQWGANLHGNLEGWRNPITAVLNQYSTDADLRSLFSQLGIETGDNFGDGVHQRVAAWYEPIKAQVEAYIALFEVLAGQMRATAATMATMSPTMGPGAAATYIPLTEGAAAIDKQIADARKKLNDLGTAVNQQAEAAITKHDADIAKRGAKKGADAAKKAAQEAEKAAREREQARDNLQKQANAEAMAAADDLVSQAEDRAKTHADAFTRAIRDQKDALEDLDNASKSVLKPLQDQLKGLQKELKVMQRDAEEALHGFDVQLHNLNGEMKQLRTDAANALKPFEDQVKDAQAELTKLQREAARVQHSFQQMMRPLQDALYDLGQKYQGIFDPLKKSIQEFDDQLYDLGQAEQAALRPMDDAIYEQNLRLQEMRDSAAAVAEVFDKQLLPLQKELEAVQNRQKNDDRNKELESMGLSVTNLSERLNNAKQGTKEYNDLIKMRADAESKLGNKRKEYSLEDQIHSIEETKKATVDAANAQVAAQEKILAAMQKQRDATARMYELQRRQIEDSKAAKEREMELAQRAYDQENELLTRKLAAIQREADLYDRQMADKQFDAEQRLQAAQDELTFQQEAWAQTEALLQAQIDKVQDLRDAKAWETSEAQRLKNIEISDLQDYIGDWQDIFNDAKQTINDHITALENQKTAVGLIDQDLVNAAKNYKNELKDGIDARTAFQNHLDVVSGYAKAFGLSMGDAEKAFNNVMPKVSGAAGDITGLSNALKNDFMPAINGLTTTSAPAFTEIFNQWENLFGTSADKGYIRKKLFAHDDTGFFTHTENMTRLAMGSGGLQGVWEQTLTALFTAIGTKIDGERPTLEPQSYATGVAIIDGMTNGAKDIAANKKLQDAVAQAVTDAIAAGKKAAESTSPSKKAYRELGVPIPQGMTNAILDGIPATQGAMRTLVNKTFGGVSVPSSGSFLPSYVAQGSVSAGRVSTGGSQDTYHIQVNVPEGVTSLPEPGDWQGWRPYVKDIGIASRSLTGKPI